MSSIFFVCVILNWVFSTSDANFEVFWNVPSSLCSIKFGVNMTQTVLKHNILVNNGETFTGDKITLIYESGIGKYPHIDPKKGDVNGGLPRLDSLDEHLKLAEKDIQKIIPNPNFNGLGIIDWEAWRPIWEYHWGSLGVYKNKTLDLVKKEHPSWSKQIIESTAKNLWESTAKQWMLKTLELAKNLRPHGMWCYYLFPDCYNYFGKDQPSQFFCNNMIKSNNDRLSWMWDASAALCPSIYFIEFQQKYNESQRIWYLYGKLSEAVRVSRPHTQIYPYINYMVHVSRIPVPKDQFWKMLSMTASLGLDGAVIWGSSGYLQSKKTCEDLEAYVENIIGPAVTTISSNVKRCSQTVCNGRGKCTWPKEPFTSWKYLIDSKGHDFDAQNIICRCQNHNGRYCS
uniref:Hyaluronidase n=1 Tax=Superstitionia donensis TaxID=311983 RepID=A0A1V1WC22_9SCOR